MSGNSHASAPQQQRPESKEGLRSGFAGGAALPLPLVHLLQRGRDPAIAGDWNSPLPRIPVETPSSAIANISTQEHMLTLYCTKMLHLLPLCPLDEPTRDGQRKIHPRYWLVVFLVSDDIIVCRHVYDYVIVMPCLHGKLKHATAPKVSQTTGW